MSILSGIVWSKAVREPDVISGEFLVIVYWAQNEMYMGGDRKKEKRFVGQRVVYDDGIKAYKTKCLRGFN